MSGEGPHCAKQSACGGFTYLGILFILAFISISLGAVGTLWSIQSTRGKERELLFVGHQFRNAIESYYLSGPAGVYQFPHSLEELIEDERGPVARRHLRRIYADPITGSSDWELITVDDGAIIGVASLSTRAPVKRAGFGLQDTQFEGTGCYCDWRFIYAPQLGGDTALAGTQF